MWILYKLGVKIDHISFDRVCGYFTNLVLKSISYHLIKYVDIYKFGVEIDHISFDRVCGYLQTWCRNRYHII